MASSHENGNWILGFKKRNLFLDDRRNYKLMKEDSISPSCSPIMMCNNGQKSKEIHISSYIEKDCFGKTQHWSTGDSRTEYCWILKTLFPQKLSGVSITNPTNTGRLQLLSLWVLKVMIRCVNDGVRTSDNWKRLILSVVVLHAVSYIWRTPNGKGRSQQWTRHGGAPVMVWTPM